MKKLTLVAAAASVLALSLTACSDDKPKTVTRTVVVHHYHNDDQVNVPQNSNPEGFQAVEKPASYSQ